MKTGVVQLLFSGQLRPRRTYDGEFVASRCGRFLRRIGGGEKGVVWVPKLCAVSSDRQLTEMLARSGYKVFHIESFSKENLLKVEKVGGALGMAAAGWLLGHVKDPSLAGLRGGTAPIQVQAPEPQPQPQLIDPAWAQFQYTIPEGPAAVPPAVIRGRGTARRPRQ